MGRQRPLNTYRRGDHLVSTCDGDVILASEARKEKWGPRKGHWVHMDDLDEPGKDDLKHTYRSERSVKPTTGDVSKNWVVYDQDGNVVPGGPADN